ncbi:MAG: hypothetical protein RL385_901 [Pseudomonadota bacterium]
MLVRVEDPTILERQEPDVVREILAVQHRCERTILVMDVYAAGLAIGHHQGLPRTRGRAVVAAARERQHQRADLPARASRSAVLARATKR